MRPVRARAPLPSDAARLLCGAPEAVLARLLPGDPLGLRARVAALVEERALLLDLERATLAVQASVALASAGACAASSLQAWLDARVEEALEELLRDGTAGAGLARLGEALGLDGAGLAAACARFDRLPEELRRAFVALVLEGERPDAQARAQGVSLGEFARRARAALEPFRGLARAAAAIPPAERRA